MQIKAGDLYRAYQEWCEAAGEFALNQRRFGASLTERGFVRYKNSGIWYRGIGLLSTQREERNKRDDFSV
jgi:phage/plasmid-associated DNA primase